MSKAKPSNSSREIEFDAVRKHVDANGEVWYVGIETKVIHGRVEFSGMAIWPEKPGYPLTRTTLRDLPLDKLFKEVIAAETKSLARFKKRQKELKPHQGRAHSGEELRVIAEVYAKAFEGHLPVQRTVAETLNIPISTAAKRIMVARKRGLISDEINKKERK